MSHRNRPLPAGKGQSLSCHAASLLTLLCLPVSAIAGGGASLDLGFGPDQYRSRSYDAYMDLNEKGWQAGIDFFDADSGGLFPLQRYSVNLRGDLGEALHLDFSASKQQDDQLLVSSAGVDVSIYLDTLWKGESGTRLDVGYERSDYGRANGLPAPAGFEFPVLERYAVGISQDLGKKLTVYVNHDEYSYSRDPAQIAKLLVRRFRVPPSKVFFLTAFPDRSSGVGIGYAPNRRLYADFSYSEMTSVLGETTRSYGLAPSFNVTDDFSLGLSVTRAETNGFGSTFYSVNASLYR